MNKPMTDEDIANLSDDELMGMAIMPTSPPEPETPDPVEPADPAPSGSLEPDPAPTPVVPVTADPHPQSAEAVEADPEEAPVDPAEGAKKDDPAADPSSVLGDPDDAPAPAATPAKDPVDGAKPKDAAAEAAAKGKDTKPTEPAKDPATTPAEVTPETVDYKAAYEKIMAFKANGKEIKLENLDEAIQLMQMGANYTKKLQALQPNLKLLKMLENNDLLDPGKLSFLIDIDKKDPKAIQKLVRESGIDPLAIDTSVDPDYKPGNHTVSDEDIRFTTTVNEVAADPTGKELILTINKTWDKQSKEMLWDDPDVLRVLTTQKENGVYDLISSEVERRKTLGYLRNEPFLQAYHMVGQEMNAKGALTPATPAAEPVTPVVPAQPSAVVETRPAQRKPAANGDKARAASPTKATPKKAPTQDFNPLAMSDEDFEKHAALANRV